MRYFFIVIALVYYHSQVEAQVLEERVILSSKVKVLLPHDFLSMNKETLALKYPNAGHRPSEVYTNERGTINVALNHTLNKAKPENLDEVKKAMVAQFNRDPFTFIK